jgi:uncharacterized protein (TIGR03435 family)
MNRFVFFVLGSLTASLAAQQPPAPAFEVVSIKPNKTGEEIAFFRAEPGGRVAATNITVRDLILRAYQLQSFQLEDGPRWTEVDRFDVTARADADTTPAQFDQMVQSLLAARFHLSVHRETRQVAAYNLTLARQDGKIAAGLRVSAEQCGPTGRPLSPAAPGVPVLPASLRKGIVTGCRLMRTPGWIMGAGQPMSAVATALSQHLGRPVTDRTGLAGNFDFSVSYMPEERARPAGPSPLGFPDIDVNAPGLFTALQEQLGLKLDAARAPAEVLVIDSVERPTPD